MKVHSCDSVRVLASGVDALYLSGRATLPALLVEELEVARSAAGESREHIPFEVAGDEFGVGWGPLRQHRFRLENRRAVVGMTTSANLPALLVQPRAEFIHAAGIEQVVQWCRDTFEPVLGWVGWQASRIDLFADVQGWSLEAEDRSRFIARANARSTYELADDLTGLSWGMGGAVAARIYDKTLESQRSRTDWWPSVWGDAYDPECQVVRIEFQVKRDALREFSLNSPDDVLASRRPLWDYLTSKWLSLRESNGDSNHSRWPVAPEWEAIQAATLNSSSVGDAVVRRGARQGDLRQILPALVGYATRAGALKGARSLPELMETLDRLFQLDEQKRGMSVEQRLAMQRFKIEAR